MYNPMLRDIVEDKADLWSIFKNFIEVWHEIHIPSINQKIIYDKLLGVPISEPINDCLNFLMELNNCICSGQKGKRYSAWEYLFEQVPCVGFDKELNAIMLMRESKQEFYFAILADEFHNPSPTITRIVRDRESNQLKFYKDKNMHDFSIEKIFIDTSKPKVKHFSALVKSQREVDTILRNLRSVFAEETIYGAVTIFEMENAIAVIEPLDWQDGTIRFSIGKWQQKSPEITKTIIDVFNWDGWSDNCRHYKM